MRLFSKKPDLVTERAKLLNEQIAALEAEIRKLADQQDHSPATASRLAHALPTPAHTNAAQAASPPQPRLRSTALPHGQTVPAAGPEPIFEELERGRLPAQPEPAASLNDHELGVRKDDLASTWQRWKNHFRGPSASNPKLVHYLSAGSIQGLRPLRYEKRVARNRFIVLAVFLVLALWGIIAIFINRK